MLSLLTPTPARTAATPADTGPPVGRPDNDAGAGFAQALQRSSDAMNTPARPPERGAPAATVGRRPDTGNTREPGTASGARQDHDTAARGPDTPARQAAEAARTGPDTPAEAGAAHPGRPAEADDAGPGSTGARWRRGGRAGPGDAPGSTAAAARRRASLGTVPGDTDAATTWAGDATSNWPQQDTDPAPDLATLTGAALPGAPLPGAPLPGAPSSGTALPGTALPGATLPGAPVPGSPTPGAAGTTPAQALPPAAQDATKPQATAGTPRDAAPAGADGMRPTGPTGAATALPAGERALPGRSTLGLAEAGAATRRNAAALPPTAEATAAADTAATARHTTPPAGEATLAPLPSPPSAATPAPTATAAASQPTTASAAQLETRAVPSEPSEPTATLAQTGPRQAALNPTERSAAREATSAESVMLAGAPPAPDSTQPPPQKPEGERRLMRSAEPRPGLADPALAGASGQPLPREGAATGLPAPGGTTADKPGPRGSATGPGARATSADTPADLATRAAAGEAVARAAAQAGREQANADTQSRGDPLAALAGAPLPADTAAGTPLRFGEQLQALMPAAQAAPGQSAAQPASARIAVPMHAPEFAPALGSQVTLFARDGIQHARIELNPAEMGPISVQIVLDGSAAKVDFHAEAALTRQAIESSLPSLAGALRDAGLTLAGGGVFQQPSGQQNGQQHNAQAGQGNASGRGPREAGEADAGTTAATVLRTGARRGLVDLVA